MVEWFASHPGAAGISVSVLMWMDWFLTVLQERERRVHVANHYRTYPVNTTEGNPLLQGAVGRARVVEPRHLAVALVIGAVVAYALQLLPQGMRLVFLGYVWGLFLIVSTMHVGNLIGYRASRRGIHGRIWMHQRTGYLIQMGRYLALSALLVALAAGSRSLFIAGVAIAGISSAVRQLVWLRRVPAIGDPDAPPVEGS